MPTVPPSGLPAAALASPVSLPRYTPFFDERFARSLDRNILQLLDRVWFRSELIGFDDYPQRNNPGCPLIFASNHSGMAFPWDGIVALSHLLRRLPRSTDVPRPLVEPMLSQSTLMNPYQVKDFWRKCGCVDATSRNFEAMLRDNHYNVMVYPEGVAGIGKGFNNRYEFQPLASSMVRFGIQHRTDIIPYYTINGEYLNPYSYSWNWLNQLTRKIGIPFLPLGFILVLLLVQPWFFYLAYPARLTYVMGTRIKPYELTATPPAELTRPDYDALTEQVRQQMQQELTAAVRQHGQHPYRWGEMWQRLRQNWRYFPFFLPFAWPALFTEFARRFEREKPGDIRLDLTSAGAWLRMLWRNPFTLCYFIPVLGWLPLFIRGYKNHRLGRRAAYRKPAA